MPQFAHNLRIARTSTIRRSTSRVTAPAAHQPQPTDLRLGRIVRLLMEHATVVVSGTKIAQEISSNRSEVWRLIQQLRGLGVDVAGHPATGYQLRSVPDLLLPEILRPLLHGTIFDEHVHHFYKIGSTNTAAMAAAAEGAPEGSVFLAEEQTAGRGRGANSWQSPRSTGIYCSVVVRPALPPSEVLVLALAAGLAVQSAIRQVDSRVIVTADLKWPNDVLIDGKKVCGILTEMNAEATRVRYIVVGVGINVNQATFPKDLSATSLRLVTGSEWSRVELAAALLKSLDHEYRGLLEDADAHESILRRFAENSSWVRGKNVRIEENGAGFEGTTEGLDPRGFLQVRTAQGMQTVLSGTVRER
ncbi:MAG TPA: biotin--[acetyl-CoA-carboxylase] ligase [Candidatus Sulfotelmatobacter sp.]|nr:biotin--[acetyl-CoA-carboxylase] ligase [Candidatus Sulfotelmatobacter sp.]